MDYDDNDFQSQNFQLSADDNKFPLPKFDIDEHLQVNLRFDSLVDTDILLGIQNQDNNWIEDFSSGTSAVEFNSSAAKTHTISRHTNVWSEATSSESVEMLLKSVGEDEMNNNKAFAMESDLQNSSNNLINPVDPTLENDNDSFVIATFVQDDLSLQPDKAERNISDQNTDASGEILLKSVVEDEMNDDKTIAMESDNSDLENASNYLISPVDPTPENDNDSSAMATFVQDDQSLQPDDVQRNISGQNTDTSGEGLSKSVGEDEMNDNKRIALESDLQNASNNPIDPVNPTPENDNDMATIVQENPSLQPDKVERNISDQNADVSEEMQLKSVGEDEMNNNEHRAMESDNTALENASSYLINPVDPTLENDNDSSTMATFVQDDPSLQPDEAETNILDQNTDASEEARQCPESASDVFACHSDLNKDDSQTVSLPLVEPTMDSFVLINDGRDISEISENRDGLLEVVACQVEVSNESEAVEIAGEKPTEIIDQNEKEFGNIEAAREVNSPVDTNLRTPDKYTVTENITGCGHSKMDMQTHETDTAAEKRVEFSTVENDEESGSKLILQENAAQSILNESVRTTEDVTASVITVAGNLKSNVSQVDKAEVTKSESEDRTGCGHSTIDMQTHETEAIVEKSVEVSIAENNEESWSKFSPQDKATQSVSYQRIQSTTEDVAISVSTDSANLKSIVSLVDKAEVTRSESEDAHMTDIGSGLDVPSAEGSTFKVKSHIDGPLSENRSSKQKEMISPKSQAYDFVDANAKEINNTEDVQVPAFKNSAAAVLVLEQSASEVSDQLSSECMNLDERETGIIANSEFAQLEGNMNNRRSEDPNFCENKLPDISQLNSMEVQRSCHVENSDGSQCKFELQSLPDKSDASPDANLQIVSGEFSSHSKENILSTPSSSSVKPPITQGGSAVVEEHIVSEQEKHEKFNKSASPDASMQTVSCYSSYGELPIPSEELILPTPSSSAVKPPITQGDSPVIEHIVSGNEKCRSDKSDASPDANVQTISNISACGNLPSHSEENILSTPSQSAVKPPILEENSPMVEVHIVSEKEKHKSDVLDVSTNANMCTGQLPSLSEEDILSTPSSSAVKPAITQGDSPMVEEHDVSEKESCKPEKSDASSDVNMQTVSSISGELPGHMEKLVMSKPSPSAVKPWITQGDSPVVEEHIVVEDKYKSDKSDASPGSNMQTVYSNSDYGELPSHSKENIMSTPSSSAVKTPMTQVDSPMVEEHIVFEEEKFRSDKLDASPGANIHTVSGELPVHIEENILTTPSLSAVKPTVTQDDSPVVEEHVSEKKYKSDKSDATVDANMHTVSSRYGYGGLPSHSEESIQSTPSSLAVKPLIAKSDSPMVEDHSVSEEDKYKCDKSETFPVANMPSHRKENIMSTPSSSAVKTPITQVDSPMVEEHIVFEEEKFRSDKLDASPGANIQTVSGELPVHSEENILTTPSLSAVKPTVTQDDSPVVEEHVPEKKYKSDKSDATVDANMHTISSRHGYGGLPSHSEESIQSTLSSLAVKPQIAKSDSPMVKDHSVSEEDKYKCDKSKAFPVANMQEVTSISGYGELPSHSEDNILSTPSSSAVKPLITQGNSLVIEERIVSRKEKHTSDKSEASADANMQIISSGLGYGEMSSHMEEKILSTPSSSAVNLKPPIAQGDSPVVKEQTILEKEKYKSDNLEASPNANMQTVSSNFGYGELPSHSEENILSTSPPSAVKPPFTQGDSPVVEQIVSKKEKDKFDNSKESPDANKHSISGISVEFSCHSGKNVMPTPSPSDVKPSGHKFDAIKHIPDSNKGIATEDDKGFSVETKKGSDMADNSTVNQMKSFTDVSASESPKTPIEITKGASEKKSTKPRAKSAKGTPIRKKAIESVGISCATPSASVGTVSSVFQLDEVKLKAESSRKRKFGSPIIQTSSLPDLNSSVSASTLVHQPFSDIQQVQLRAQIFVYGSLIQGIPPDEACMQSAFGDKDGGKSIWETAWRKAVDRYQTQKSPANQETPLLSHSVVRTPNQETKSSSSQSKVSDTSASKFVGKPIAPAIPNTPSLVQSPVWNMTPNFPRAMQLDFNKASTPLHPYSSSQTRQFSNTSTPWLPSNPRPAQWAISSQSPALKSATQYSSVLAVDTVKVTPIRESSLPHTSFIPSPVPVSIPLESQGKTASAQKSRKRKKPLVIEDISKTILVSQSTPISIVPKSLPTLLPIAPLTNTPLKVTTEPIVETVPHISPPAASSSCQITNTVNDAQIAKFSEETGNKVQQAKVHAEEAASMAASIVSHGQGIWNQIAAHKNSSVPIEVETKLASVAAAAAAAASVAKAAASAAKVAFEAVVQAKVMADEAINSAKTGANFDATKNLAMLTPGSILKGKDKMHGSSTIISAACDAAQKRVEEASAASKRAENLNAIMKAAELAAEAVSHVGTIIAMGDPLPFKLSELVEAGPEGSWKTFNKADKLKESEQPEKASVSYQETQQTALKDAELPVEAEDNCDGSERGVGKSSTLSNDGHEKGPRILEENAFRKGSLVEVISDENGLKGGWFSARVLDVADKKVHVCYNNLLSDDGSEQLKEWVSLDSEINGAPRIRNAHPGTVTKNEGTKKRRREATDNYVWEVGDHVDAWMRDGWWEGIITEKNQLDETKLTVHFPAGGDSSLVRAWDLRTSLSWKGGQWAEWSRAEASKPHEGDTPQEKRRKVAQLESKTDDKGDGKVANKEPSSKIPQMAEASRPLNLSAKDTIFSLGKKEDYKSEALKGKRTGPHREGPGVVFGVPKGPGKKQKFMEVSKHYSTDKSNQGKEKDSFKFPKYLMPQPSQPWRNASKVDSRGKRAVDSKSTGVKSTRASNNNARNVKQKESSNNASVTPASNDENRDKNHMEDSDSSRPGSTESLAAMHNASKKKPSSVNEGDRGVKRRFAPSSVSYKSAKKAEVSEGETSDANEPRRSTRKIQPTSRLLEGLQSSMMMSRIPSFTQSKSSKTPYRSSSSSRGNSRG